MRAPLSVQFFFIFMQFSGKIDQNNRLAPPPLGLAPRPLGNPGSATGPLWEILDPPLDNATMIYLSKCLWIPTFEELNYLRTSQTFYPDV